MRVWLVATYRPQFFRVMEQSGGIDGLIRASRGKVPLSGECVGGEPSRTRLRTFHETQHFIEEPAPWVRFPSPAPPPA
jgi:hypothetical protein